MRRIRARLRDLQSTVLQQQRLLAAYGGTDGDGDADATRAAALSALDRAEGALRFLPEEGDFAAVAAEFRSLFAAVAPALRST
jgi:hypothetical protein